MSTSYTAACLTRTCQRTIYCLSGSGEVGDLDWRPQTWLRAGQPPEWGPEEQLTYSMLPFPALSPPSPLSPEARMTPPGRDRKSPSPSVHQAQPLGSIPRHQGSSDREEPLTRTVGQGIQITKQKKAMQKMQRPCDVGGKKTSGAVGHPQR